MNITSFATDSQINYAKMTSSDYTFDSIEKLNQNTIQKKIH